MDVLLPQEPARMRNSNAVVPDSIPFPTPTNITQDKCLLIIRIPPPDVSTNLNSLDLFGLTPDCVLELETYHELLTLGEWNKLFQDIHMFSLKRDNTIPAFVQQHHLDELHPDFVSMTREHYADSERLVLYDVIDLAKVYMLIWALKKGYKQCLYADFPTIHPTSLQNVSKFYMPNKRENDYLIATSNDLQTLEEMIASFKQERVAYPFHVYNTLLTKMLNTFFPTE